MCMPDAIASTNLDYSSLHSGWMEASLGTLRDSMISSMIPLFLYRYFSEVGPICEALKC